MLAIRYLARVFIKDAPPPATARFAADLADAVDQPDWMALQVGELQPSGLMVPRAGLTVPDRNVTLLWRGESVDLESAVPTHELPVFAEQAGKMLSSVIQRYSKMGHRLALVREAFLDDLAPEVLNDAPRRLLTEAALGNVSPFEWDVRVARHVKRRFGSKTEETNTITSVHRGPLLKVGSTEQLDRLRFTTDVNTVASATDARFGSDDVAAFFAASVDWHLSLGEEILGLIR